ncbi:MAG: leucine-rich repeat domain-containing protein [Candidatus Hodarchaeales archaeon]|jgi:hypothetical protein
MMPDNNSKITLTINEYLTIELERNRENQTAIYVDDMVYVIPSSIGVLEMPIDKDKRAQKKYDISTDNISQGLPKKFRSLYSSIQLWAKRDYNNHNNNGKVLIPPDLALPLLEHLRSAGDPIAESVLQEEVVKGISSGNIYLILFMILLGLAEYAPGDFLKQEIENPHSKFLESLFLILKSQNSENKFNLSAFNYKKYSLKFFLKFSSNLDVNTRQQLVNLLKREKKFNLVHINYLSERLPVTDIPEWVYEIAGQDFYTQKYVDEGVQHSDVSFLGLLDILTGVRTKKITSFEEIGWNHAQYYTVDDYGFVSGIYISYPEEPCIGIIPKQIGNLKHLEELHLFNQDIKIIPEFLREMKSLKVLNLSSNPITLIPNFYESHGKLLLKDTSYGKISMKEGAYLFIWVNDKNLLNRFLKLNSDYL